MKIVLAIDSFKGSLTSAEVEQTVAEAIHRQLPDCEVDCIPIADGGEGTLSVMMNHEQGTLRTVYAHNPCMEIIPATYGISEDRQTAFIEMAAISGLPLISEEQKNPMNTTTFGTGELIRDALNKGCRRFILGIGGSATNDAGIGMLQALGYRFFNTDEKLLGQGGKVLSQVSRIDDSQRHPMLKNAHFIAACDVRNPFYGPQGAAAVFARQKGADDRMIACLDKGMQSFAQVIVQTTGKDISQLPGSGAAGGLGGCLAAFFDAELKSGADLLLDLNHFSERISEADLVITGEGKIDRQSLMGKITGRILQRTTEQQVSTLALAGQAEDIPLLFQAGFKGIYPIHSGLMPLEEAMKPDITRRNLQRTISKILSNFFNCG